MHKRYYIFISLLIILNGLSQITLAATHWKPLAQGLEYATLVSKEMTPWGQLHAFRINPKLYQLQLAFASDQQIQATNIRKIAENNNALIAINGGFFTPDFKPIGLRINNGNIRHGLKNISWWGVFYIENKHPNLVAQRAYRYKKTMTLAIQGGPRLIVDGYIPKLKPGIAERSAIGITRDQRIIILVTNNAPVTTTELAEIMQRSTEENGLDCENALNLDGGKSSQLYARIDNFRLSVPGLSAITDAVLVTARQ